MRKFKSLVSLLLVAVLICLSGVTAFAESTEDELSQRVIELNELILEMYYAFGIGADFYNPPDPGSKAPNWLKTVDSENARNTCGEALDIFLTYRGEYFLYEGEINAQTVTEMCDKLNEELHKIVIDRIEVEELVAICEKESNDDCYYDEELWNGFQAEIAQAKELLADESIVDQRVTTAFYDLMYQYNLLCTFNTVPCDVDNDGIMTIMDATYIQRFLVGLETLNTSQLFVLGGFGPFYPEDITITYATRIQRRCAEISKPPGYGSNLSKLMSKVEKSNPESEEFRYDSIKWNMMYYGTEMSWCTD